MDHKLLAVDPSIRGCGWAVFEGRKLTRCGLVAAPMGVRDIEAWVIIARGVAEGAGPGAFEVVGEKPQIYKTGKADPDDLLQICGALGAVCGAVDTVKSTTWTPRQWKGNQAKETTARIATQALDTGETARYLACVAAVPEQLRHNVLDAIAIGLKKCHRIR